LKNWTWIFLVLSLYACNKEFEYIDKDYPLDEPKLFAEGIINLPDRLQQNISISQDGTEYYFTQTDGEIWRYERILRVKLLGGQVELDTPQFVRDFEYENEQFIGEPMLSPDDNRLYFIADYPPDIFSTKRLDNGGWSVVPIKHALSTSKDDWYITFSGDNLLFTNGTAYTSSRKNDAYRPAKKLEAEFNNSDVRDPVLSKDESFIIIAKKASEESDQMDLFISFRNDGDWSEPIALNDKINTEAFEFAPYISPDGKFLFFSRRDSWINATYSSIYWVSLSSILESTRDSQQPQSDPTR